MNTVAFRGIGAARYLRLSILAACLGMFAIPQSLAELPGDIAVAAPRVNIGDLIKVELRLPAGGPYGGGLSPAFISLARPGAATQDYLQYFGFGPDGLSGSHTIPFQAPFETGHLEVRLYAWQYAEAPQMIIPLEIVFDPVPGAIGIEKRAFAPDEQIAITTALPASRNYYGLIAPMSLPWIAVLPKGSDNPRIDRISSFDFGLELGAAGMRQIMLRAPSQPGSYVVALYHGASSRNEYMLDAVDIEVAATAEEAQRINDALGRTVPPRPGADVDPRVAAERDAAAAPGELPGQVDTAVVRKKPGGLNVTVLGLDGRPVINPKVHVFDFGDPGDSAESTGKGLVIRVYATDDPKSGSYETIIHVPDGKDVDLTVRLAPLSNASRGYLKAENAEKAGDALGYAEGYAEFKQAVEEAERVYAEGRNAVDAWAKENDLPILTSKQVSKQLKAAETVGFDRQDKKAVDLLRNYKAMLDRLDRSRNDAEFLRSRLAELKPPKG
jgi:hypothetical protein